ECDLNLAREKVNRLQIQCPIQLNLKIPARALKGLQIPTELGALIQGDLKTSTWIPSAETRIEGSLNLKLEPLLTSLFLGKAEVNSHIDGVLSEFPERGAIDTQLQMSLVLFRFEELVAQLKNGP